MTCETPSHNHKGPYDPVCGKEAAQIGSVVLFARDNGVPPEVFVKAEEGTYNPITNHFLCDSCFVKEEIRLGQRLVGTNGTSWVCP